MTAAAAAAAAVARIHECTTAISIGGDALTDSDDEHEDDHRETSGAHLRAENNASCSSTTADPARPAARSPPSPLKPSASPVSSPSPWNNREGTALNGSEDLPGSSCERWRGDRVEWPGVLRKAFFVPRFAVWGVGLVVKEDVLETKKHSKSRTARRVAEGAT